MEDKIKKTLKIFIEDFLSDFGFEYNIEDILIEIKNGLDKICEKFLKGELIIDYKNICDESNNTDYVKDLRMVVSDTYVKFEENGETFVIQSTIMKKTWVDIREEISEFSEK